MGINLKDFIDVDEIEFTDYQLLVGYIKLYGFESIFDNYFSSDLDNMQYNSKKNRKSTNKSYSIYNNANYYKYNSDNNGYKEAA